MGDESSHSLGYLQPLKKQCALTYHVADATHQLEEITETGLVPAREVCIIWKGSKIEEITTSTVSYTV